MAFIIGGLTLARQPSARTLAGMVDQIMTASGIPAPGVVTSPSKHTTVAVSSINQAMSRIWTAAKWDWRVRWVQFEMEDLVFMYELPADFAEYCVGPVRISDRFGLMHFPYEKLMASFPDLHWATNAAMTEAGLLTIQDIAEQFEERDYYDKPRYWGIRGSQMYLFPIPSESSYADSVEWNYEKAGMFAYYTSYNDLVNSADELLVPPALINSVFFLANAYFKQAFEYPDFQADEQRGERLLSLAVNRNRKLHPASAYSHFITTVTPFGAHHGL